MTETAMPQLTAPFVTDGGLETELVFIDGIDLPQFAAYPLLRDDAGRARLRRYAEGYLAVAAEHGLGMVLETPTWRANADWGALLGDDAAALDAVNRDGIAFLRDVAAAHPDVPCVVSGNIGPRGDGYAPASLMTADEAAAYHDAQIASFAAAGADLVTALTMGYAAEAIGIARAAGQHGLPVVLSFTVETDGRLPSGQALGEAIEQVDAATGGTVAYYMVNCAHPTHFATSLVGDWTARVRGLRANASTKSHAELDESTELDAGDPADLAARCVALRTALPSLTVLGGCCGTDARHVAAMWSTWAGSTITT